MSGGTQREQIVALRARVARLERLVAELELRSRVVVPSSVPLIVGAVRGTSRVEPASTD